MQTDVQQYANRISGVRPASVHCRPTASYAVRSTVAARTGAATAAMISSDTAPA